MDDNDGDRANDSEGMNIVDVRIKKVIMMIMILVVVIMMMIMRIMLMMMRRRGRGMTLPFLFYCFCFFGKLTQFVTKYKNTKQDVQIGP